MNNKQIKIFYFMEETSIISKILIQKKVFLKIIRLNSRKNIETL
jgi:hypothetical protein